MSKSIKGSVKGLGSVSLRQAQNAAANNQAANSTPHMTLGVDHLIGPRWNEEKEEEFGQLQEAVEMLKVDPRWNQAGDRLNKVEKSVNNLFVWQMITFILVIVLALKVFIW